MHSSVKNGTWLASTSIAAPFLAMAAINYWLGSQDFQSEILHIAKWGFYIGEFAVLAAWFSWSPDVLICRLAIAWVFGTSLSMSTWCGYYIARPESATSYKYEFLQSFTTLPASFLLASVPLLWFRSPKFLLNTRLFRESRIATRLSISILCLLLAASMYAGTTIYSDFWDIVTPLLVALVLGGFLLACVPLTAVGILRARPQPLPLLTATVLFPIPAIIFAFVWHSPGPGGTGDLAILEAIVVSLIPFLVLVSNMLIWRFVGVRTVFEPRASGMDCTTR